MIRRLKIENENYHDHADGPWCLHTDHIACIAALEAENAKLREEVARFREGMPMADDIRRAKHALEICTGASWIHESAREHSRIISWLRSIAAKVGVSND